MTLLDLIDFRAFSSFWYWLLVCLIWVRSMGHARGVPLDLLRRAEAGDGPARTALEALVAAEDQARARRPEAFVALEVGIWSFGLTVLAVLGLGYGQELAQACLLIALPQGMVGLVTGRAARAMAGADGAALRARLFRLNRHVQWIGIAAVFVSSIFGMLVNLSRSTF